VAILIILAAGLIGPVWSSILILLWVWLSGTSWRELGFVRTSAWSIAMAVFLGIIFKLLMKSVVMPLLGADPINHAYHYLAGNPAAIGGMLFAIFIGAGIGEEVFFRGWMFERLGKLLGTSIVAKSAIVIFSASLFGAAHYAVQGLAGTEQAAIVGLVFGTIFTITGSLVPLMCAHVAFDLMAYALIYWNLETRVAHAFFS
jgi:membrane protease YdiL (CAAX protease family)